jgi:hypothetical protein
VRMKTEIIFQIKSRRHHRVCLSGSSRVGQEHHIYRASQPLYEEGQGSRSPTARTDEDARNRPRAGKGRSNSSRPSGCTIRQRIMVGLERNRQTRGSSTPPESAGQVNPGRSAHDATRSAHERFMTDTYVRSPRLQAATIRGEARSKGRCTPTPRLPHRYAESSRKSMNEAGRQGRSAGSAWTKNRRSRRSY